MATVKEVKDLKARVAELETEVGQLKDECNGHVDEVVKLTQQVDELTATKSALEILVDINNEIADDQIDGLNAVINANNQVADEDLAVVAAQLYFAGQALGTITTYLGDDYEVPRRIAQAAYDGIRTSLIEIHDDLVNDNAYTKQCDGCEDCECQT